MNFVTVTRSVQVNPPTGPVLSGGNTHFGEYMDVFYEDAFPPALLATLTTRTDNDTGVFTMTVGAGHGLVIGDRLDVYWSAGAPTPALDGEDPGGIQFGMVVSNVSGALVTASGTGTPVGNNLPGVTAVLKVSKVKEYAVQTYSTKTRGIIHMANGGRSGLSFATAANVYNGFTQVLTEGGGLTERAERDGTGIGISFTNVTKAFVSCDKTTGPSEVLAVVLYGSRAFPSKPPVSDF